MNETLKNKGALVTGGSRGIGAASLKRLASEGTNVARALTLREDDSSADTE